MKKKKQFVCTLKEVNSRAQSTLEELIPVLTFTGIGVYRTLYSLQPTTTTTTIVSSCTPAAIHASSKAVDVVVSDNVTHSGSP